MKVAVLVLEESPLLPKGAKVGDTIGLEYADADGVPVVPDLVNLGLIESLNEPFVGSK